MLTSGVLGLILTPTSIIKDPAITVIVSKKGIKFPLSDSKRIDIRCVHEQKSRSAL